MKINIEERMLHFRQPAGTSRGVYTERRIWLLVVQDGEHRGMGECAPLPRLSCDDRPDYTEVLRSFCDEVERTGVIPYEAMRSYPSMLFGLETALLDMESPLLFDTPFSRGEAGITINGLVWMGSFDEMYKRIEEKLLAGFHCVKLKIGAIDWDSELSLIRFVRSHFTESQIELRVDANGGFLPTDAFQKLEALSAWGVHSIEQPIPPYYSPCWQGDRMAAWKQIAALCRETPVPIALDEELIGVNKIDDKQLLLDTIRPQYIILKPSLHGGMAGCREWVSLARERGIGSWMTSALESNVGLNAIARFCSDVYGHPITMPQGLGTGQLFTDNIPMPLEIRGEKLWVVV